MGVTSYKDRKGVRWWQADFRVRSPDGREKRIIKRKIPTKEMALMYQAKVRTEVFEGRYFLRKRLSSLTVNQAWSNYQQVSKREKKSWQSDAGRAAHVAKHLGEKKAQTLTQRDVDNYRTKRLGEVTRRGKPPAYSTLNREIALLRLILNYAVKCGELEANPLAKVELLQENNVRKVMVEEADFARLLDAAEDKLKPILLMLYDTGMRLRSVLNLKWSSVSLTGSRAKIHLAPQDVKGKRAPVIILTNRVKAELEQIPRSITGFVFVNPCTGRPWVDIRRMFNRAIAKAELDRGIWVHDLRRSFITLARRRGVDESTVMSMSGHTTRSAFERYNIVSERDQEEAVNKMEAGQTRDLVWKKAGSE